MKTSCLIAASFLALASTTTLRASDPPGGKVVQSIHWADVKLPAQATISQDGTLVVKQTEAKPTTLLLLKIEAPGIHTKAYALRCQLQSKGVEGQGYLEMWNEFPPDEAGKDGQRFFTRTMAESGPMGRISGTSSWHPVVLPFNAEGAKSEPRKIELNLVLSGRGEVQIKGMELVEFADSGAMFNSLNLAAQAPEAASRPWIRGPYSFSTVVVIVVVAFLIVRNLRKRHDREQRRMRAMDAG
jgi:hypothetical protein